MARYAEESKSQQAQLVGLAQLLQRAKQGPGGVTAVTEYLLSTDSSPSLGDMRTVDHFVEKELNEALRKCNRRASIAEGALHSTLETLCLVRAVMCALERCARQQGTGHRVNLDRLVALDSMITTLKLQQAAVHVKIPAWDHRVHTKWEPETKSLHLGPVEQKDKRRALGGVDGEGTCRRLVMQLLPDHCRAKAPNVFTLWEAIVLPVSEVEACKALAWEAWNKVMEEGSERDMQMKRALVEDLDRAKQLVLYAVLDAAPNAEVEDLWRKVVLPFANYVGLSRVSAERALALWRVDRGGELAAQDIGRMVRNAGIPDGPQDVYRQVLWMLVYHNQCIEASDLMDSRPPHPLEPLDGALAVACMSSTRGGDVHGVRSWEEAFLLQRKLAQGPLAAHTVEQRFLPLRVLAHRLVNDRHAQDLLSLPMTPVEAQVVISMLFTDTTLYNGDHVLVCLLLQRCEWLRAYAVILLLKEDLGATDRELHDSLTHIVQQLKPLLREEDLRAVEDSAASSDQNVLRAIARLGPPTDEEVKELHPQQPAGPMTVRRKGLRARRARTAGRMTVEQNGSHDAPQAPSQESGITWGNISSDRRGESMMDVVGTPEQLTPSPYGYNSLPRPQPGQSRRRSPAQLRPEYDYMRSRSVERPIL